MTDHGQGAAPGWYPTPDGHQRYWDGRQWTEHVAPLATPHPDAAAQRDPRSSSQPDKRPWYVKKRFIIPMAAFGVLFFLSILGSLMPDPEGTEEAQPSRPPAGTQSAAPATSSPTPEEEPSTTEPTAEPQAVQEAPTTEPPPPDEAGVDPWVNRENYERIEEGMTMQQVEAILGGPGELRTESRYFGDMYVWMTEGPATGSGEPGGIYVSFMDGVVSTMAASDGLP